jgi:hypothetical protein
MLLRYGTYHPGTYNNCQMNTSPAWFGVFKDPSTVSIASRLAPNFHQVRFREKKQNLNSCKLIVFYSWHPACVFAQQ